MPKKQYKSLTAKQDMSYKEVKPHKKLSEFIVSYWKFEFKLNKKSSPEKIIEHTVFPDGCISLLFVYDHNVKSKRMLLMGTKIKNYVTPVYPGLMVAGIRFFPGALYSLFNIDGSGLRDKVVPCEEILKGIEFNDIMESLDIDFNNFDLFDKVFLDYISKKNPRLDVDITDAVKRVLESSGNIKMSDLCLKSNLSERQLQRKFKKLTGLTPKEFARIRRIRSSLVDIMLHNKDYQNVIFDAGYFDQAHFIKDFSTIAGINPGEFNNYISQIEHIDVEP